MWLCHPGLIFLLPSDQRPKNSGVLVRQGHGSLVLPSPRFELTKPITPSIGLRIVESAQNRSTSVNQELPNVFVPSFADPQEPGFSAAGMLPGNQSYPSGKLPTISEGSPVSHGRNHRRGCEDANSRNLLNPPIHLLASTDGLDLFFIGFNVGL
jgi:hypothetical protein